MTRSYHLPPIILMGAGTLHKLPTHLEHLPGQRALLVTDKSLVELGIAGQVAEVLGATGKKVIIYDQVEPDPDLSQVARGVETLRREGCDLVVAVGGGSPIDCAKGITLVGSLEEGRKLTLDRLLPLIAIPTTAGTGSEATDVLVITDREAQEKLPIITPLALPRIAVCDPELTVKLPPKLTAATGIDALTHAVEAYLSTGTTPFSDALSLQAIAMISKSLPVAVKRGSDIEARDAMMEAQFLAGVAFNTAGLGYVHAMAHPLGALFHVPHGVANGLLLEHVMAFNLPVRARRLADIALAMGEDTAGLGGRLAGRRAISAIRNLVDNLGLPHSLREVGVKEGDLPDLAAQAVQDPTGATAPRRATREELVEIYRQALEAGRFHD